MIGVVKSACNLLHLSISHPTIFERRCRSSYSTAYLPTRHERTASLPDRAQDTPHQRTPHCHLHDLRPDESYAPLSIIFNLPTHFLFKAIFMSACYQRSTILLFSCSFDVKTSACRCRCRGRREPLPVRLETAG